jgi:hypothetical protein
MLARSCRNQWSSLNNSVYSWAQNEIQLQIHGGYPGFSFRFGYPHFVPLSSTVLILEKKDHPLRAKYKRQYENIDPNVMWPCFTAPLKGFKQGILRSHYRRQLRKVFTAALHEKGLDRNGRWIEESGMPAKHMSSPIRGTILFMITQDLPGIPNSDLHKSCIKVIERVENEWKRHHVQ